MLSEEERKAIQMLDKFITEHKLFNIKQSDGLEENIRINLNLLEKLQKEIEKKNKVIDLIAKMINTHDIYDDICGQFGKNKDCSDFTNEELCIDCIKQYFYRKVEE